MTLTSKITRKLQDDKEMCKKLLIQFLKMHHLMPYIYAHADKGIISMGSRVVGPRFADAFINLIDYVSFDETNALQLSQFWRFYLLERIDLFSESNQAFLTTDIRSALCNNGLRNSKELEKLFKKHSIIPKKRT